MRAIEGLKASGIQSIADCLSHYGEPMGFGQKSACSLLKKVVNFFFGNKTAGKPTNAA